MMNKQLKALSALAVASLTLIGGNAMAEQTIGIQPAGTVAVATARVNVRVTVPKIVILRVGAADASLSDVNFTVGVSPAVTGAPGDSLAYTGGAIPPTFATTVATTNPTTSAGALTVAAWTNFPGTTLRCSLGALAGATAFATGATTAAGVPGTSDITVASAGAAPLQHPGTNLAACNGTTTTPIAPLSVLGGTFTYGTTFTASALAAGVYGNIVTYTATTL